MQSFWLLLSQKKIKCRSILDWIGKCEHTRSVRIYDLWFLLKNVDWYIHSYFSFMWHVFLCSSKIYTYSAVILRQMNNYFKKFPAADHPIYHFSYDVRLDLLLHLMFAVLKQLFFIVFEKTFFPLFGNKSLSFDHNNEFQILNFQKVGWTKKYFKDKTLERK